MKKNLPDNIHNSQPTMKASRSPLTGPAWMVLGVGKAVLGLIGKGIRGSFRLLMKHRRSRLSGQQNKTIADQNQI
ncbi:MAG TPA: hypothetical protein VK616_16845 [Flavitalea sp.]|nr:hypothetical protein [Flavitalea sp.]HTF28479.1 hypothetical protein [Flavitalea sp.]